MYEDSICNKRIWISSGSSSQVDCFRKNDDAKDDRLADYTNSRVNIAYVFEKLAGVSSITMLSVMFQYSFLYNKLIITAMINNHRDRRCANIRAKSFIPKASGKLYNFQISY